MNQSKIPPPSDGSKCTSRYQTPRMRNSSVLMLVLVLVTKRTYGDISETKRSAGVKATRCSMPFQIYRYTSPSALPFEVPPWTKDEVRQLEVRARKTSSYE